MTKLTTIDFHDDTLFAVEDGGAVFVAVKPICDGLGLKWSGQHDRLNRDPILAEGIRVMRIPSPGGVQDATALRLDLLQGWLFGIDAARVKPEIRARVLAYKRECYAVLFRHFYGRRPDAAVDPVYRPAMSLDARRRLVAETRKTFGTRAAGEMWRELGLPTVPEMRWPAQPELPLTPTAPAA